MEIPFDLVVTSNGLNLHADFDGDGGASGMTVPGLPGHGTSESRCVPRFHSRICQRTGTQRTHLL